MATVKRDQILQEAEKLAARGKLDAAVKEYRRALEQIPNDTSTLNRLGDLLVRLERTSEAIEVFQRVAEHFAGDGFFLKAIAIFKRVNRLDPQRTEIYERLADLYFKQGLVVEGRQQLLTLADWFTRSRNMEDAVRVFRRLADLEPSNFQARAKLIDLLVQTGDVGGVTTEIDSLGRSLLSRGMLDEALKLYHRALELNPEKTDFLAPCIEALIGNARVVQAVELANRGLSAGKGGIELKRAAARAFAESGDVKSARRLLEEVIPEVGERTDVVQLYGDILLRVGEAEQAKDKVLPAVDRLLGAGDVGRAAALIKRLIGSAPGDIDVLERAVKVFDRRDDPDMANSIEASLADAYFRSGRKQPSLQLYRSLAQRDPENPLFRQRLEALGGVPATVQPAPGSVPATLDDAPRRVVEVVPDQPQSGLLEEEPEVEFVDVDLADDGGEPTGEIVRQSDYVFGVAPPAAASAVPASGAPTTAMELFTEAVVFAKYGLSDKAISHLHRVLALEPTHQAARELLASLGGGEVAEVEFGGDAVFEAALPRQPEPAPLVDAVPSFEQPVGPVVPTEGGVPDVEIAVLEVSPERTDTPRAVETPVIVPPSVPEVASSPSRPGLAPVRLENLEAILGLGEAVPKAAKPAPARTPKTSLEAQIGFDLAGLVGLPSRPEPAQAPLAWGPEVAQPTQPQPESVEPAPRFEEPTPFEVPPVQVDVESTADEAVELLEVSGMLGGPADDVLREIDFFIEQGLLDEAARQLVKLREQFPDHGEVKSRQALLKARGWEEGALPKAAEASAAELFSEEEQFFDLAAELEKELAEDELVAEARGAEQSGEVSIEELFKEFQRGVAEQIHEEDYDTHFNLGLAYREMGLLDEAIGEFQLAAKSGPLFIEAASMIGASYLDKGLPEQAAEWFSRALTAPDIPAEAELGLKYELGRAQEAAGNLSGALSNFAEVLALNPGFRDVVERVSRLQITH